MMEETRYHYLYKITNKINGKIYIGQTVQPQKRWSQHKRHSRKPNQIVHHAINKYGAENFKFEVIAMCKSWDDANDIETELVSQYQSLVPEGYNVALGGINAPKSEEWKAAWKKWQQSLSEEEWAKINKKRSEATYNQIEKNGHPCFGQKRTEEQRAKMSAAQQAKDFEAIYTPEVREKMSESHKGIKQSEELVNKRMAAIKLARDKKIKERTESGELKCNASGCNIHGKASYLIVDGIRYCSVHGQRLNRTGSLELGPRTSHNKGKKTPEEVLKKLRGRKPHNRIEFTKEQISIIMDKTRSIKSLSREFGVTEKVIVRVRKENS